MIYGRPLPEPVLCEVCQDDLHSCDHCPEDVCLTCQPDGWDDWYAVATCSICTPVYHWTLRYRWGQWCSRREELIRAVQRELTPLYNLLFLLRTSYADRQLRRAEKRALIGF